ncbi:helix-turn-helix domain-containing protein [Chitinilyticum aquatile]|uniref:helix-turn-helix domain-containing protein n=1 Tax=Chitinilyticum aquatile TaxID=362520 RepID=UPI001B7FD0CB|nr:helix-turn-helix transcriptional regulator [Chitinilyticum aquatile]
MTVLRGATAGVIAAEIGARLKQARLNANISIADLAQQTGLSRNAITGAEKGKVQLVTLLAIMVALKLTEQLDLFLPPQQISPVQLAMLQGKKRQRASRKSAEKNPTSSTHHGEENDSW